MWQHRHSGRKLIRAKPPQTKTSVSSQQLYDNYYNQALTDSGLGTGGKTQRVIQAATAAIQGLAGSDLSAALAGGSTPYIAHAIGESKLGDSEKVMAHAVVNAALAAAQGKNGKGVIATAAGAGAGELTGVLSRSIYGKTPEVMSETEKQTVSALATVASGLAGGLTGDSSANALAGAQAGKTTTENNALSSKDEQQRQDAKWSLPYLNGEKKQQAEKLVSDLNAKDKAFDAALDSACKNLSSAECRGMRQDLTSMGKSYDEKLDGQYIGNMGTVYKDGKAQVNELMWQYATADVKAERDVNVNRIAENWGVSKETAANLYDGMAVIHTTAAIGGAVYGLKGAGASEQSAGTIKSSAQPGRVPTYVEEPSFNPSGTGGAAHPWSTKGRINYVQLPNEGKIRYIPPEDYSPSQPLPRGPNNGYIDKFKNEWVKGPSRTAGQEFEWDVQLSRTGKAQLGWATRDGSHLNVSLDGKITHK